MASRGFDVGVRSHRRRNRVGLPRGEPCEELRGQWVFGVDRHGRLEGGRRCRRRAGARLERARANEEVRGFGLFAVRRRRQRPQNAGGSRRFAETLQPGRDLPPQLAVDAQRQSGRRQFHRFVQVAFARGQPSGKRRARPSERRRVGRGTRLFDPGTKPGLVSAGARSPRERCRRSHRRPDSRARGRPLRRRKSAAALMRKFAGNHTDFERIRAWGAD